MFKKAECRRGWMLPRTAALFIAITAIFIFSSCSNRTTESDDNENSYDYNYRAEADYENYSLIDEQNDFINSQDDDTYIQEEADDYQSGDVQLDVQNELPDYSATDGQDDDAYIHEETDDYQYEDVQDDIQNELPGSSAADGQDNTVYTHEESVINQSNDNHPDVQDEPLEIVVNQPGTAETRVVDFELTPRQRETFDRFVASISIPGNVVTLQTPGFSHVQIGIGTDPTAGTTLFAMGEDGVGDALAGIAMPTMRLIVTTDAQSLSEFVTGARNIVEGRMFQEAGEVIVSREFAELNNLSIGNSIEFASTDLSITDIVVMEIVGIYSITNPGFAAHPAFDRRNEIITAAETLLNHPKFAEGLNPVF